MALSGTTLLLGAGAAGFVGWLLLRPSSARAATLPTPAPRPVLTGPMPIPPPGSAPAPSTSPALQDRALFRRMVETGYAPSVEERLQMVRVAQAQLRDVSNYTGPINGDFRAVEAAMQGFAEREELRYSDRSFYPLWYLFLGLDNFYRYQTGLPLIEVPVPPQRTI